MFAFKANLTFVNVYRTNPILAPFYRPLLFFSDKLIRSSELPLNIGEKYEMDRVYLDRIIKIPIHSDIDPFLEFYVGRKFVMKEGVAVVLGVGEITQILGEINVDMFVGQQLKV